MFMPVVFLGRYECRVPLELCKVSINYFTSVHYANTASNTYHLVLRAFAGVEAHEWRGSLWRFW